MPMSTTDEEAASPGEDPEETPAPEDGGTTDPRGPESDLLWRNSPEYADLFPPEDASRWAWQHRATVPVALRYAFVLALVTVLLQWLLPAQEPASDDALRTAVRIAQTLALTSGLFFLGVVWIRHAGARRAFHDRVHAARADQVAQATRDLHPDLRLDQLFRLNRLQLDEYHALSVRQASVALRNAITAAAAACLFLAVGAVVALQPAEDESGRYVAGGLCALGAVLSAFLSGVFALSYKETARQLREHYQEPARTGRILALERLAADPRQEKGALQLDLQKMLVKQLLEDLRHNGSGAPPGTGRTDAGARGREP
jgi:hypothetical protein